MDNSRTKALLGEHKCGILRGAHVAIFGIGGVGGYVAECLARVGIGTLTLVDYDIVEESNCNRQIIADKSTLGMSKVDAMTKRIALIDDSIVVKGVKLPFNQNNLSMFDFEYDYIADCIDSMPDKKLLISTAKTKLIPIICAMGAGNRYSIPQYKVADIHSTSYDPLAKSIRKYCVENGVKTLDVVYSTDTSAKSAGAVGSVSYHPMAMGSIIASKIVNNILEEI